MTLNPVLMNLSAVHESLAKHELINSDLQVSSVKRTVLGKLWVQIKKFFFAAKAYRLEALICSVAERLIGEMRTQPAVRLSVVEHLIVRAKHIKKKRHQAALLNLIHDKFREVEGSSANSTAHPVQGSSHGGSPQGRLALGGALGTSEGALDTLDGTLDTSDGALDTSDGALGASEGSAGVATTGTAAVVGTFSRLPTGNEPASLQEEVYAPPALDDRRFYRQDGSSLLQEQGDITVRQQLLSCGWISNLSDYQGHFDQLMAIYNDGALGGCRPTANRALLREYVGSEAFMRDAQTARVYFNGLEMTKKDASQVAWLREPVNLFASNVDYSGTPYFDSDTLLKAVGHCQSAYNDAERKKEDGSAFRDLPNSVSIYAQTPLWKRPGDPGSCIQVACLSVPAPALDDEKQPHYSYYMSQVPVEGTDVIQWRLDVQKYRKEMDHLAKVVVQATLDHREGAFDGQGIGRLIITRYGQANFLGKVTHSEDKAAAKAAYYASLKEEILRRKEELGNLPIVISEFGGFENSDMQEQFVTPLKAAGLNVAFINGDILENAEDGDLIVNAWDPHSLPGNGNDWDRSLDGVLGRGTAIGCTQNPWINSYINSNNDWVWQAVN